MSIESFADWLDATTLSTAFKDNFWFVPSVQSVHFIALSFVFPYSIILALRAWKLAGTDWSTQQWASRLYPWMWWSLLVLLATGVMMIIAEPTRELPNPAFQFKMVCLVIVVPLALKLSRIFGQSDDLTPGSRVLATAMVILWFAMLFAGRWIAYA